MASNFGAVSHLLPPGYKRMVTEWLEEDCPSFDYAGFVVGEEVKEARLLGKSPVGHPFALYSSLAYKKTGVTSSAILISFLDVKSGQCVLSNRSVSRSTIVASITHMFGNAHAWLSV